MSTRVLDLALSVTILIVFGLAFARLVSGYNSVQGSRGSVVPLEVEGENDALQDSCRRG